MANPLKYYGKRYIGIRDGNCPTREKVFTAKKWSMWTVILVGTFSITICATICLIIDCSKTDHFKPYSQATFIQINVQFCSGPVTSYTRPFWCLSFRPSTFDLSRKNVRLKFKINTSFKFRAYKVLHVRAIW